MEEIKELESLIKKARKKEIEKERIVRELFQILNDLEVNLEQLTEAENASNIADAITCYIDYGEYNVKSIVDEIKRQTKP
jgi:predicted transcriptional regulator